MTLRRLLFAVSFLLTTSGVYRAQVTASPSAQVGTLSVFLDCDDCSSEYVRTEIAFVNWVRDRTAADVHVLVTEVHDLGVDRVVATAIGRIESGRDVARFGSIEDVWVEPGYRGQGICRALVVQLTDFFQAQGVQKLTLGFAHGGTAAGLWQRLGFIPSVVIANSDIDTVRARSS